MLIKEGVYPATIENNIVRLRIKNKFYKIVTYESIRVKGIHNCRYETGGIGKFNWHTVFVGWEPFKIKTIEKVNGVLFPNEVNKLLHNDCKFYYLGENNQVLYAMKFHDSFGYNVLSIYDATRTDENRYKPLETYNWNDKEVWLFAIIHTPDQLYDMTIENVVKDWSLAYLESSGIS